MKQLNSHNFEKVYKWLGINLDTLGCVMLDVESINIPSKKDNQTLPSFYYAKDRERFWIDGWVAGKNAHITLLYGLLGDGKDFGLHIKEVLEGWELKTIKIKDIGYFESPYPDESYYCVVAHIEMTSNLLEGHQRLEFLPHINTFTGYKPHLTLAYINKDEVMRDIFITNLKKELVGKSIEIKSLNLGDKK